MLRPLLQFLVRFQRQITISTALLMLVAGAGAYSLWIGPVLAWPDEHDYLDLGRNLVEFGTYSLY